MPDLILPEIRKRTMAGHHGCYEIGPVGAALSVPLASGPRRVFLASLEGAAITSVQIGGVQHEFQDTPEVLEDVTDIVLHFKKVRLRSFQCVLCICIWMYRGKAW